MLTVLAGLAEFERELMHARTGEGRARAKAKAGAVWPETQALAASTREKHGRGGRKGKPLPLLPEAKRQPQHDFEAQSMNTIILYRIDGQKHMHRYYRMDLQPDLFGQWCLMREWGSSGQIRCILFPELGRC